MLAISSKTAQQIAANIRDILQEDGRSDEVETFADLDQPANVIDAAKALDVPLSRVMRGL